MVTYRKKADKRQTEKTTWMNEIRGMKGEMRLREEACRDGENWRHKITGKI